MKLIRFFLWFYRLSLNFFFRLNKENIMDSGSTCIISEFNFEENQGDIVHPCVRYSEKLFKGYNWWLIYTPYYNANADIENPILCYGISKDGEPPTDWTVYKEVIGKPLHGYNSDPTMFFDNEGLHVFWRENTTPRTKKDDLYRATYGCLISEKDKEDIKTPILCEKEVFVDKEVSPAIFKLEDSYVGYAMHMRFKNKKLHSSIGFIERLIQVSLKLSSVLEIYNEQKTHGIAIWKSKSIDKPFKYIKTTKIQNCNRLYRPWHLDVFNHKDRLYAIIQTTQCNADICLAVSDDNENFKMFTKPLITNRSINKVGIYKPTGFVYKDVFYLYYTAQDRNNRKLNKMYLTSIPFSKLLNLMK